jgi:NAD(P)H-nitrite reductase large subunit
MPFSHDNTNSLITNGFISDVRNIMENKNVKKIGSDECSRYVNLLYLLYISEFKQQSKQWTEAGCSAPKKTTSVPSAGKFMASVFWDAKSIF